MLRVQVSVGANRDGVLVFVVSLLFFHGGERVVVVRCRDLIRCCLLLERSGGEVVRWV